MLRNFLVKGGGHGQHTAVLQDLVELAFRLGGNFLPDGCSGGHAPALEGVDDDIVLGGLFAGDGILDVLLVIHVRRSVTHEEDNFQHVPALAPFHLVYRLVQGLVHGLGRVAAALRLESGELGVNVVDVFAKGIGLGDIGVSLVTIADEAALDLGGGYT